MGLPTWVTIIIFGFVATVYTSILSILIDKVCSTNDDEQMIMLSLFYFYFIVHEKYVQVDLLQVAHV